MKYLKMIFLFLPIFIFCNLCADATTTSTSTSSLSSSTLEINSIESIIKTFQSISKEERRYFIFDEINKDLFDKRKDLKKIFLTAQKKQNLSFSSNINL